MSHSYGNNGSQGVPQGDSQPQQKAQFQPPQQAQPWQQPHPGPQGQQYPQGQPGYYQPANQPGHHPGYQQAPYGQPPQPGAFSVQSKQMVSSLKSKPWNILGGACALLVSFFMLIFAVLPWGKASLDRITAKSNGFGVIVSINLPKDEELFPLGSSLYIAVFTLGSIILVAAGGLLLLFNKKIKLALNLAASGAALGAAFSFFYILSGAKIDYFLTVMALANSDAYLTRIEKPDLSYGVFFFFLLTAASTAAYVYLAVKRADIFEMPATAITLPKKQQQAYPMPPQGYYPPQGYQVPPQGAPGHPVPPQHSAQQGVPVQPVPPQQQGNPAQNFPPQQSSVQSAPQSPQGEQSAPQGELRPHSNSHPDSSAKEDPQSSS